MGTTRTIVSPILSRFAADRRAEREANELIGEAISALVAVRAGDVEQMWAAHELVNRAALLLLHRRGGEA